jgi:iron(II)-dependent oxidoreductase
MSLPDPTTAVPSPEVVATWVQDARRRTLELIADLNDEQLFGPHLAIINPLLWEIGHVSWFQEKWVVRHAAGRPPVLSTADALYDSAAIAHDTRWDLPLPSRRQTLDYMQRVHDGVLERLAGRPGLEDIYFTMLSVFHEDMHGEAFTYTRQTLGYPPPRMPRPAGAPSEVDAPLQGDAAMAGGTFMLGATADEPFVFDNEKWAHPVTLEPFAIARAPVTQGEFAQFVDHGGYRRRELWDDEGSRWRQAAGAEHPPYWRRQGRNWLRRDFTTWVPLELHRPMIHVNWHEAQAYCRWAHRRLPTEAEWEAAASRADDERAKRCFPWGADPPTAEHANLDGRALGCVSVAAHPAGDSACGCRQFLGNVWEWTADAFGPYPGFVPDPYKEYSAPWFGDHRALRGGCWATRGRLLRNTWRNFYRPDRRDVFAGFRTCAP